MQTRSKKWLNHQWKRFHAGKSRQSKVWHRDTIRYFKFMWQHDYDEVDRKICGDVHKWVKDGFYFLSTYC